MDSALHGASQGHGQELSEALHPHLDLQRTMVHVPKIKPGDYVVWHCDGSSYPTPSACFPPKCRKETDHSTGIHAVDKTHAGKSDSSVMYIPVCPVTVSNAEYLARQRDTFEGGYPGPDFPGGLGESLHIGRPTRGTFTELSEEAARSMGLQSLVVDEDGEGAGAKEVVETANKILGFA